MPEVKTASFFSIFVTCAMVILGGVVAVSVSAATGVILGYLFPATVFETLTLLGLGKFALWQVSAGVMITALTFKPFISVFK